MTQPATHSTTHSTAAPELIDLPEARSRAERLAAALDALAAGQERLLDLADRREAAIRAAGRLRTEGRDYAMRPNDVCHFLFGK